MGNEQAIPQQNQGNQTGFQGASERAAISSNSSYNISGSFSSNSFLPDYKIVIVVRGTRKTGKTTLITRIRGFPFDNEYQTTPSNEVTDIPWRSPAQENILVSAWDTVEHCNTQINSNDATSQQDATTVNTLEKADAVVIMIDNRFEESIDLAEKLIIEAPDNLPLAVFSNYMDLENSSPLIPTKLMQYMGRFFFIPGSLKTNQGLIELSKWLTLPLLNAKAKVAYSSYLSSEQECKDLEASFSKYTADFLNLSTALTHIKSEKKSTDSSSNQTQSEHGHIYKKAYQRRPLKRAQQSSSSIKDNNSQNNTQAQNATVKSQNSKSTEDSFWDDDDDTDKNNTSTNSINKTNSKVIRRRVVKKNSNSSSSNNINEDNDNDEIIRPNPLVKPLKSSTNKIQQQNSSTEPTTEVTQASTPQENDTTKRRRIIKRKSQSGIVQQQTQQQQPQQQKPSTVVRRKKKIVHHTQNTVVPEIETGNEQAVDGYESF